jgi:hypothetical protein
MGAWPPPPQSWSNGVSLDQRLATCPLPALCHNNQISVVIEPGASECLTENFRARLLPRRFGGAMGGVGHDYYPCQCDRSRRRRDDRFGLWGLYVLMVGELRLRDHLLTIQTIAVGFVLIGLAQALRLLLALMALQPGH